MELILIELGDDASFQNLSNSSGEVGGPEMDIGESFIKHVAKAQDQVSIFRDACSVVWPTSCRCLMYKVLFAFSFGFSS